MTINLKAKQQLQYVGKEAGGGGDSGNGDEVLNPFHQHNADTPWRVPTQKKEGASLRHTLFSMDIKYIIDFILLPRNQLSFTINALAPDVASMLQESK